MDNQDHRKNYTPGHDGHGVHVCHKCGWPFPNPHPSAKHRRSHKKICGTIEGYKVVQSEGSTHSTVNNDDEQQSDEDLKTPSPRVVERSNSQKGSVNTEDRSGRSEDEVFSDAVAEFPDGGSGKGIEDLTENVKKSATSVIAFADRNKITTLSDDDATKTDIFLPLTKEAQGSSLSRCEENSQNHVSSATIDFMERSLSGYRNEEFIYESNDDRSSKFDSNPIQPEVCPSVVSENHEKIAGQIVSEADARGNGETQPNCNNSGDDFIEMDTEAFQSANIDNQMLGVEVSPSAIVGAASEAVSVLVKPEGETLDCARDAGGIQSKQQFNDKSDSSISFSGPSLGAESIEHIDSAQIKMDSVQEVTAGSSEESRNENVYIFSVPGDIPVMENAEVMIQGFKDIKGRRLPQLVNVDSLELSNEVKKSVSMDTASNICRDQSNECTEVSVSDIYVSELNREHVGGNKEHELEHHMPEVKVLNESQRMEEFDAHANVSATEIETRCIVHCPEKQLSDDKSSSPSFPSEHATEVSKDANPVAPPCDIGVGLTANLVNVADASDVEISRAKKHDNEVDKGIREESSIENLIATSDEGKVGKYCAAGNETEAPDSTAGSLEEDHLLKNAIPISADDLQENYVSSEHAVNALEGNLLAPEYLRLDSDNQKGVEEIESNDNGMVQMESTANVIAAVESDTARELQMSSATDGDVKLLQNLSDNVGVMHKSGDDNVAKESHISSLATSASIQYHTTVTDNPARDFIAISSDNQAESFCAEGNDRFDTHQVVTSVTDLSVDSSSQTDSLEGQWGSVSVLSTQSDMPAIIDAEPMASNSSKASAEADKSDLKDPKAFPVGQQPTEKSDIFEPPSFMTLVEPSRGDKASASEIQIGQNIEQLKATSLQAGWFPSLTNVVNESQGRKKNQEIIAKVTNWSAGKQHTPLKNLLGEAHSENKSKLLNLNESPMPVVHTDETNTGVKEHVSTANSDVDTKSPVVGPAKKDAGKEWNSPARYPADIKREKRKVKGRAYWAQFMCCSSVS